MILIRALLIVLILFGIISRVSVAAYQKDMSVLSTTYEVHHQDLKQAVKEEEKAKRDAIIANYAIAFLTMAFFASFLFGKKSEFADSTAENK